MSMFGVLASGRLVDTSFRQVDATHVVVDLPDPDALKHVVVFLTGAQAFPDDCGGAVYFAWPAENPQETQWQLLGILSNAKPSAIFKISRRKQTDQGNSGDSPASGMPRNGSSSSDLIARFGGLASSPGVSPAAAAGTAASPNPGQKPCAQLGVSMEPLTQLSGLASASADASPSSEPSSLEFARWMVDSLFNYAGSFTVSPAQLVERARAEGPAAAVDSLYVPFSSLRAWYENFERRLRQDPTFWKK